LAALREQVGDAVGAEALYREAVNHGHTDALRGLAALRERAGDAAGANQLRKFGLTSAGEVTTGLDFGI
jgi:hypothetical protein